VLLSAVALGFVGLGWTASVPGRLTDGSRPHPVPKVLRAQGHDFVMTKVRVLRVGRIKRLVDSCARGDRIPMRAAIVERVGINGRSITFTSLDGGITGCDRSLRARTIFAPWCGGSAWLLHNGKVTDPRVDICADQRGRPVIAFGWINPVRRAKWIVIDQPGYGEVYPVAGGLPVRVSTVSGLGHTGGAAFRTTQYDGAGVLLVRRKVVAAIAS
jgi:hypothetical protein